MDYDGTRTVYSNNSLISQLQSYILHKLTLWTINYVTEKDSLESFCGGFSPGKYTHCKLNFEGYFQVKLPHKSCKDPSGSFHGVFSSDIIDGSQCKCFQKKQLWVGKHVHKKITQSLISLRHQNLAIHNDWFLYSAKSAFEKSTICFCSPFHINKHIKTKMVQTIIFRS